MDEIELAGGGINRVVRIGNLVHRPAAPWSAATRTLLETLGAAGVPVPRWHGVDDQGREILDFLPGDVGHYPLPDAVRSEAALISAARVLRSFHDASVPLLSLSLPWQLPPLPDAEAPSQPPSPEPVEGSPHPTTDATSQPPPPEPVEESPQPPPQPDAEVIVHGDYAPYNLVFTGDQVSGIIDLDYARPGPRTYDLSYALYRFAPLTVADEGWGSLAERTARIRLFCETYGLDACSVADAVAAVAPRLRGMVTYMRAEAAAGHEAFARHIAEGHDALYERDARYVEEHLAELV